MRFAKYVLLYVGSMVGAYLVWTGVRQGREMEMALSVLAAFVVFVFSLGVFVEAFRGEIVNDVCYRLRGPETGGSPGSGSDAHAGS